MDASDQLGDPDVVCKAALCEEANDVGANTLSPVLTAKPITDFCCGRIERIDIKQKAHLPHWFGIAQHCKHLMMIACIGQLDKRRPLLL